MTCIAGVVHEGVVYIGADSAGIAGWELILRKDEKVFINGPFLIGFTDSFRMGQLLQFRLSAPQHDEDIDSFQYLVTSVIDEVRRCLKEGGYAKKDNEVETAGAFLIGYRGRLFEIHRDYQVGESLNDIGAVGCGSSVVLCALYALKDVEPIERIRRALEIAERFNAGVRGPFIVKKLPE